MRIDARVALIALLGFALIARAGDGACARFDDPRPEGRFSPRERSLCEPSEQRRDWCDYPHEIRAFLDRRDACDHFRGEPWPEGDSAEARDRRRQLNDAMREHCTGSDRELASLRAKYGGQSDISKLLAEFEDDIEP